MIADIKQLNQLLELIEDHLDLEHCNQVDARYRRSLAGEPTDRPPLVVSAQWGSDWKLPAPWSRFERYFFRQSFEDPIAMMQSMLLDRVVPGVFLKDDSPLAIRNNHGTVQIASLLGGNWGMHENDPPWVKPWESIDQVREFVASDEPVDLSGGVIKQSLETLEFYAEQLSKFPKCEKAIQISLPDLQGPFDTAEQLWGSGIYIGLYEERELVSALMDKVAQTMLEVEAIYRTHTRDRLDPFAGTQHGYNIPGRFLIRNDSSILISPADYRDVVAPIDARLLKAVGGGTIHFCGNGEHLVEAIVEIPEAKGLDVGQSVLMDVDRIYGICREHNVALTNHIPSREQLLDGTILHKFPTGIVTVYETESIEDAREVLQAFQR